jgi:uncharacterized damage-inducible protein DinB
MNTLFELGADVSCGQIMAYAPHAEPRRRLAIDFGPTDSSAPAIPEVDGGRILAAAVEILNQGEDLLTVLTLEHYTKRVPLAFNGSIGGHYRHCLDHFTSWLRALDSDLVDYDRRERDPLIETDPVFARHLTRQMRESLERMTPDDLARMVKTRCEVSYVHGGSPLTVSTYGRELVYAIAHSVHHYALISVMARLLEVTLPPQFGVAPSTVAHRRVHNSH